MAVGSHRRRSIKVLDITMPDSAPSGLWLRHGDRDVIVVDEAAPPSRRAAIVCHEIAHMLLDHGDPEELRTETLALLAPDVDPEVRRRYMSRRGYIDERESAAERVGTRLAAEVLRRQRHPRWHGDRIATRLR